MAKKAFIDQINAIMTSLGKDNLKGHGIQIGGTLEFLLWGVPFNFVKSLGCWSSDAFILYLHQYVIIIEHSESYNSHVTLCHMLGIVDSNESPPLVTLREE